MKVIDFKDFPDESTPICADKLNELQELLFKAIYPVGSYYETSDKSFDPNVSFGGTSLIIVVGVALDIVKAMESQLLMRHYKGFLE